MDRFLQKISNKTVETLIPEKDDSAEIPTDEEDSVLTDKGIKVKKPLLKGVQKSYKKKFMSDWLKLPEFRDWLIKGKDLDEAICRVCNVVMKAGKSELKKHSNGKNHVKNIEADKKVGQPSVSTFVSQNSKVKHTEAALCSFIVENNLAVSLVEPLVELIKNMPEKSIVDQISVAKQKATNIIRNGLRPFFQEDLVSKLKETFFSVYIDETTDVSVKKQLAVMVSYCENFETKVDIIDIIDCPDGTAETLYKKLVDSLKDNCIPTENWIGFCCDTTNVMVGQHNSVVKLIKDNYPKVLVSKCACHMIHLVSSYACTKLPNSMEDLCRNIFSHFSRSPKNTAAFQGFQAFFDLKPHKILKPCQTRWLSLQACVKRILEQWQALEQYWVVLSFEDPTHANTHTLKTLQNPLIKCLMYFVDYALGLFNDFNCFFQADCPQFAELKLKTEDLVKTLAFNFMDPEYVTKTPAFEIDPHLSGKFNKLDNIYLGVQATALLSEIENKDQTEVNKLLESVKHFYIEAIKQIKNHFVFEYVHLDASFLIPNNAYNLKPPSVYSLGKKYLPSHLNVDWEKLDNEWRSQRLMISCDSIANMNTISYWKELFGKTEMGKPKFIELPKLINYFMALPFSNAAIERLFSSLNEIKTDKRNRLDNETLASILAVKHGMKRTKLSSTTIMKNLVTIPHLKNVVANATASQSKRIRLCDSTPT